MIWGLPETYSRKEEAERAAARGRAEGKSIYFDQIDEDLWTVEERGADPSYFMNHSCDSNLWLKDEVTLI
ncbi:MAG: hypothetical protein JSW29_01950, partial [Candidatus Bathyarchaeota archaeon]